jgi:hypothetical protein
MKYLIAIVALFATLISALPLAAKDQAAVDFLVGDHPNLDDVALRNAFQDHVAALFMAGDFEALEDAATQLAEKRMKTPSGLDRLNQFHWGMDMLLAAAVAEPQIKAHAESFIANWIKLFPNRPSAHIAKAQMMLQLAQNDSEVRDVESYLKGHEAAAQGDPRWDMVQLDIASRLRVPLDTYMAVAEQAFARNPWYQQSYFQTAVYVLAQSNGSLAALETFAQKAKTYTAATDGNAIYARIYWVAAQSYLDGGIFNRSTPQWSEMKLAMDDVLKSYPDSWNTYNFAMFACFAQDKDLTRTLITKLPHDAPAPGWPYPMAFSDCKVFAGLP